jgi:hypothetical protein
MQNGKPLLDFYAFALPMMEPLRSPKKRFAHFLFPALLPLTSSSAISPRQFPARGGPRSRLFCHDPLDLGPQRRSQRLDERSRRPRAALSDLPVPTLRVRAPTRLFAARFGGFNPRFFARLLELDSLADVSREKGKFRSFLLASFNHYLADEWDRGRAQKRGDGRVISLEAGVAEARLSREPADTLTPEKLFERKWAMTLLEAVVQRLQREYESAGRLPLFMALRFSIAGGED